MKSRILSVLFYLCLAGLLLACQCNILTPEPVFPVPTEQQLAWHEMEMNGFIHFTINTFTDLEWGMGSESPALFNPSQPDPDQWANILQKTGCKGIILTCKHHDGFCLWPSQYTEHSVKNSPYRGGKGDIVRELSDVCNKYGMKFGVYLSPWDRNHATYGKPEYITYYRNQLEELFTSYGPIFEMWFDGANGGTGYYGGANERRTIDGKAYYDWSNTLDMIRKMQPEVIFFSDAGPGVRWVGNEKGIAGETNWCMITPDTLYAGKPGIEKLLNEGSEDGTHWIPAETDVSIRPGWFYHEKEDSLVKSAEELFEIYLSSVGRGSVLLLNVPPDRRGMINDNDIRSLHGFRVMLDSVFRSNLAAGSRVESGSYRGHSKQFVPGNVTDGNSETFWSTDDNVLTEYLEINLGKPQNINYIVLQEYIRLGQRIKEFNLEVLSGKKWIQVAEGTTIGYKRILKIVPVTGSHIRLNITGAKACPVISNLELY